MLPSQRAGQALAGLGADDVTGSDRDTVIKYIIQLTQMQTATAQNLPTWGRTQLFAACKRQLAPRVPTFARLALVLSPGKASINHLSTAHLDDHSPATLASFLHIDSRRLTQLPGHYGGHAVLRAYECIHTPVM